MAGWTEEQINADYWDRCARDEGLTVESWKLLERIRTELSNQESTIYQKICDRCDLLEENIGDLSKEMVADQDLQYEAHSNSLQAIRKQISDLDEFYSVRIVEIGDKVRWLPSVAQKALQTSIVAGAGWIIAVLLAVYIWAR